ncbi:hypothetical protein B9Z19DRAFT_1070885 [Tuber borchii]|uniref:Uncharacterized protein n=1 Tax=Tuber borchii TaxID=42251 RepID=A0A2T7A8I1_TUBBO|nr:hypothetical protein B9Z19DRAFT_1070885 [Tuber borchii]
MCKLSFPSPHLYLSLTFHFFCVIAGPCGCLDNRINDDRARGGIVISRMNFFYALDRFTGHHSGFYSPSILLGKIELLV